MTRLLTFQFDEGRPHLSPEEEAMIQTRTLAAGFQTVLRDPASTLVVVGYIDPVADDHERRRLAFRRAQILADLLRDKCGARAAIQVITHRVRNLPPGEQTGKQRAAEVWMVNP